MVRSSVVGAVVALVAGTLGGALNGDVAVAATAKTPAAVTKACAEDKIPGFGVTPGASDVVLTPGTTAKVTFFACLDRPVPAGGEVVAEASAFEDGAHNHVSATLHRSAESPLVYWATASVAHDAPTGGWGGDGMLIVGGRVKIDHEFAFTVRRATKLTIDAAPEPASYGSTTTVTVALSREAKTGTWQGHGSRAVKVYFDPSGSAPRKLVATLHTDAAGRASTKVTARQSGVWSARYTGTTNFTSAASAGDHVTVVPASHLSVDVAPEPATRGSRLTVVGTLTRDKAVGSTSRVPSAGRKVTISFDPTGSAPERTVGSVVTGKGGTFRTRTPRVTAGGRWIFRVAGTATLGGASAVDSVSLR